MAVGGKRKQRRHGNFLGTQQQKWKKEFYRAHCPQECYSFDGKFGQKAFVFVLSVFPCSVFSEFNFASNFCVLCYSSFSAWLSFVAFYFAPERFPFTAIKSGQVCVFLCLPYFTFLCLFQKALNGAMKSFSMFIVTRCVSRNQWSGIKRITFLLLTCHSPPTPDQKLFPSFYDASSQENWKFRIRRSFCLFNVFSNQWYESPKLNFISTLNCRNFIFSPPKTAPKFDTRSRNNFSLFCQRLCCCCCQADRKILDCILIKFNNRELSPSKRNERKNVFLPAFRYVFARFLSRKL